MCVGQPPRQAFGGAPFWKSSPGPWAFRVSRQVLVRVIFPEFLLAANPLILSIHSPRQSSRTLRSIIAWRMLLAAGLVTPVVVRANPTGGVVAAGSATITATNPATVVVTQASNRAIINWSDFSISSGEITKFIQPSAASATLNRVIGSNPSALLGGLQSNGQVYLINPNGIVVGQGARIDAGGFTASTLDTSDAGFLAGKDMVLSGQSGAAVANLGAIDASQGNVYLVAQQVTNAGSIRAANGTAGLAAGTEVTLTENGTEHVLVGSPVTSAGTGGAAVLNSGTIRAAQAELRAEDGNLYALAINNTGVVRATGVRSVGGHIFLTADGTVNVGGAVDADAKAAGGHVVVTGADVNIGAGAEVSANGGTHGGTVLIGGDRAGGANPLLDLSATPVANAQYTTVAAGAKISANGASGDGGSVVVWSDAGTQYFGSISARGGLLAGSGGFAEVSGRNLNFLGTVDLGAPAGKAGTLLLDPIDLTINDSTPQDSSVGGTGASGSPFAPVSGPSTLTWGTILGALGSANVFITTSGTPTAGTGNITIAESPNAEGNSGAYNSANSLTLTTAASAGISLLSGANVVNAGTGGITLNSGSGGIALGANLGTGGNVTLNSSGAVTQTAGILTAAGLTLQGSGNVGSVGTPISVSAPSVTLSNLGNVTIADSTAVALQGTTGGNLNLTAGGSITESGAITANAGTTTLAVTAAGSDILLGTQANDFGTTAPVFGGTLSDIRDVSLRNTNAGATLPSFAGLTGLRNLTVAFDNAAVGLPALTLTGGGSLSVTAGGAITQTAGDTVPGTSSFTAGANSITLTKANSLTGAVSLSNSGANNVALTNGLATALGTSSVGTGTLTVSSTGAITQTGALTQGAGAGTASFAAGANAITLTQANGLTGAVSLTNSGANAVSLTNGTATILGTSSVGTGTLTVNSTGAITQTGVVTQPAGAGAATFTAGANAITLTQANGLTGAVSLNNSGANAVSLTNGVATVIGASSVGSRDPGGDLDRGDHADRGGDAGGWSGGGLLHGRGQCDHADPGQ